MVLRMHAARLCVFGLVAGCSTAAVSTADGTVDATGDVVFSADLADVQPADALAPDAAADASADTESADAEHADVADATSDAAEPADTSDSGPMDTAGALDVAAGLDIFGPSDASSAGPDVGPSPVGAPTTVWDLDAVQNQATANCQFANKHTVMEGLTALDAWNLTYTSWEVVAGVPQAIQIRGFAARPQGTAKLPGVVQAHGLGGMSKESDATSLAARLGTFVVAYTGPGGGDKPDNTSEGLPAAAQNGYRMFDTLVDVRGSWFWGHATAAMRAVTCLQSRSDVDGQKLGITGFSAGGVVSTLLAARDPRIVAAVPLSGTLAWDVATASPTAWQNPLLVKAGLTTASPEWQKLLSGLIAPTAAFFSGSTAHLLALDGTTDEFFPLSALMETWNAAPDAAKRLSLSANFDHGSYLLTALTESKTTIEARAKEHAEGAQRMWFGHWFGTDPWFVYVPTAPQVTVQPLGGGASLIVAVVDGGGSKLAVDAVEAWVSTDDAFTFLKVSLDPGNGVYSKAIAGAPAANTVYFVDVIYKTKELLARKFSISSPPVLPTGHVPHIRAMDTCL